MINFVCDQKLSFKICCHETFLFNKELLDTFCPRFVKLQFIAPLTKRCEIPKYRKFATFSNFGDNTKYHPSKRFISYQIDAKCNFLLLK